MILIAIADLALSLGSEFQRYFQVVSTLLQTGMQHGCFFFWLSFFWPEFHRYFQVVNGLLQTFGSAVLCC
jgi:hypothetical protein